jgi:hypothetical protein
MPSKFDEELKEPEEKKDFQNADYNPLDEPVNEKTYTQPNINTSGADFTKPIEEPRFAPPPLEKKKFQSSQEKEKKEPINPEFSEMPKKEKEMAASAMANMVVSGYEFLTNLANKTLVISEKKLEKLQAEGEINLNAMIDYDYGKKMRAGDFIKEYNNQIQGILRVDEEFKEEILPVLTRIFAKRGMGMTDEQLAIYIIGKHAVGNGMIWFQAKSQSTAMINSIKAATMNEFAPQTPPPPPPQQAYQQQEQPQPQEPQEEFVVEEEYKVKPDLIVMPTKRRGRPKK